MRADQSAPPTHRPRTSKDGEVPAPRRRKKQAEPEDFGWVISFGCKTAGELRRLKVDTDPSSDTRPIDVPCLCGEVHRVTVSPYRRRRSADEPFDVEVTSLDELRSS
jgi:hypothetical protein